MLNFEFISPTKFVFGRGAENKAGELCAAYSKKVLLVYGGGSIKANGLYDRVTKSLKDAGVEYFDLGGVVPNPRLNLALKGVEICRKNNVGLVLAVGGGSSIDTAKFIALALANEGDVFERSYLNGEPLTKAFPIGTIPTIAAAGSEGSNSSVITRDDDMLKRGIGVDCVRPAFSLLNPELTFSCPSYQTAAGLVDMMTHVMERYFSKTRNVDITDMICEALLKTMIKHGAIILKEPENYESRAEIMWAGMLAHNNICGVGREHDWSSHRMSHELSAYFDATHGAALAVIYPEFMRYIYKSDVARFVRFATEVWGVFNDPFNPEAVALEGINRTRAFFNQIGMPSKISEFGAKKDQCMMLAEHTKYNLNGKVGSIVELDKQDICNIFNMMF